MAHAGGRPPIWTRWRVMRILNSMLADLKEEEHHRSKTFHLGALLERYELYPDIAARWTEKYGNDEEFRRAVSRIKNILESRIVSGAMRGTYDSFFASFNLKNNYGWKDDPDAARRDETRLSIEVAEIRKSLSDEVRDEIVHLPAHATVRTDG